MIRTELQLRLPNSPGALASVCQLLADDRVNIIAMSLDAGGHCRFIVDNPVRASGLLRDQHHRVTERDVIVLSVAGGPGAIVPMLALVRDAGVNLNYVYGGAAEGSPTAAVVLGVDDAQRAAAAAGI